MSSVPPIPSWSAIVAKARGYDMKVTVDDQFVNAKGKPMESVPLVMMAASEWRPSGQNSKRAKARLGCQRHRCDGDHRR
ncbi:hypothetical protein J4733_17820 [Klebsiella pneumoniae]|uniref:Uncharacterized protein n=1 Tax=Klebsiella pneumoniae TaxID=573 RepID=A0A939NLQ5_KLEPN|nr:hypothetical protein [Klebsiella pneumoniae]